jgi:hypothetical protein
VCTLTGTETQKVALQSGIVLADVAVQSVSERVQLVHHLAALTGLVGAEHGLHSFDQLTVLANVMRVLGEVTELHQPLLGNRVRLGALQQHRQQAGGDGGIKLIDERLLRGDQAILRVVFVDDETEAIRDFGPPSSWPLHPSSIFRSARSQTPYPSGGYAASSRGWASLTASIA